MTDNNNSLPPCYGKLDIVFPMQGDGLRSTPDSCRMCLEKTMCLQAAAAGRDGLQIAEEKIDRAYASGSMSFFERWLRKKGVALKKEKYNST